MLCDIYLRNGTVFIPTLAETDAGFFRVVEPVEVVPATDVQALQLAIKQALNRGNPRIPTPPRGGSSIPVLAQYAKVKSRSAFERGAMLWGVSEKGGSYKIVPGRKCPDGGWENDPTRIESLPPGTTPDTIAERVVSLISLAEGQH